VIGVAYKVVPVTGSILGTRVPRVEDPDLLLGRASYVSNLRFPGLGHVAFARSPAAHARITGIDTGAAAAAPGVLAVATAGTLGLPAFHGFMVLNERCARPPLAAGKVRFAGEPVAAVVAETPAQAEDAAELIGVDYEPLPAVTDPVAALAPGAPLQFEELGSNLAAGLADPEPPDGADPLGGAAAVVRLRLVNQRVAVVPMETDAILAAPGADEGYDLTVYVSTQMPHGFHTRAAKLLGLEPERLRVIAPHVGGAFGSKAGVAAEHLVVIDLARRLGRPLRWVGTRSENLVAMAHGRGQIDWVEMAFGGDGRIQGMRCRVLSDAGAYAGFGGGLGLGPTRMMAAGPYRIPRLHFAAASALTNTSPMGAFRGAGRPEAAELLERTLDVAAGTLGLDPVEIRRRNLLPREAFPVTTAAGTTYDSGDYTAALDEALRLAGYPRLRAEQAARRASGDPRALGIGVSCYVEVTAGGGGGEFGAVEVLPDGDVVVRVGTSAHGQGHATAFAMLAADRLGVPMDRIRVVQSDTAAVPRGGGTGGSRSLQMAGNAVAAASGNVADRARRLVAQRFEAAVEDIVAADGRVGVAGDPDAALGWPEIARLAAADGEPLAASVDFTQPGATFPFGAHVAVVEVDLETGKVRPLRHVAVDDCGRIVNPVIVAGQQHGGIAQGMAQALWEEVRFDGDGNPVTSTLADYAMPSAAELPSFEAANTETATPLNPLGAKGIGESGTVGSTPAVHNAVIDALAHLGVRHIDMPCTPERVWQAIEAARAGSLPPLWEDPPEVFGKLPVRGETGRPEAAGADI